MQNNTCGYSGGVGGLFLSSKYGNSGEDEGVREMGVWIFSGTTICNNGSGVVLLVAASFIKVKREKGSGQLVLMVIFFDTTFPQIILKMHLGGGYI